MSAGALVIKNAILALLVILIVHFAIKNMLFEKELDHLRVKEEMVNDVIINPSIAPPMASEVPMPVPELSNTTPVVQCEKKQESDLESLYKYVFSGTNGNAAKTEITTKTTTKAMEGNGMFAAYDNKEPMFSAW